jgi:hypothetical protein
MASPLTGEAESEKLFTPRGQQDEEPVCPHCGMTLVRQRDARPFPSAAVCVLFSAAAVIITTIIAIRILGFTGPNDTSLALYCKIPTRSRPPRVTKTRRCD